MVVVTASLISCYERKPFEMEICNAHIVDVTTSSLPVPVAVAGVDVVLLVTVVVDVMAGTIVLR